MELVLGFLVAFGLLGFFGWERIKRVKRSEAIMRKIPDRDFPTQWEELLRIHVPFYSRLNASERRKFTYEVHCFLLNFEMIGVDTKVTDLDRLLVAAGGVIPTFRLEKWHYKNLSRIIIYPDKFPIPESDQLAKGLTGQGEMFGQVWFSRKAIYEGFAIDSDGKNVVIHEFIHLMDMQDGFADGLIGEVMSNIEKEEWKTIARDVAKKIQTGQSFIREYAIANPLEFISATSEYYFETPEKLRSEHPKLYRALDKIYTPKKERSRFSYQ
ncbi:M90 family metallopeptidase [Crocinitomix algicola]|uniref:M90 family metallopeptidase n=1 Tax=Crocinitomix algicola TaxID=1740263 RepID=UPI00082B2A5C|nr:M90 family metallopeptidase [Crocinitomix algicola]